MPVPKLWFLAVSCITNGSRIERWRVNEIEGYLSVFEGYLAVSFFQFFLK
jgi:hypothetical protein